MPENTANTPRRIGGAIFLATAFIGVAAIAPYLFDLVFSSAPDPPTQPAVIYSNPLPPYVALELVRRRDAELSETYGWVNKERNTVRVPLDRARAHMLSAGLPSR